MQQSLAQLLCDASRSCRASAAAPSLAARRLLHASARACIRRATPQQPGMLPDSRLFPPAAEGAAAAILEARRLVFGAVQGNDARSGRKALRATLSGRALKDYYEPRLTELGLEAVGVENPVREELFRAEEEKNRIGKTRIKGKMRGTSPAFARWMKLADADEAILEPIDVFAPADALPEAEVIEELSQDMSEAELRWLHSLLGKVAASAERDSLADDAAEAEGVSAADKKATARRVHFRSGLDDKRLKPVGGEVGEEPAPVAEAAAEAEGEAAEAGAAEASPPAAVFGSEEEKRVVQELEKALTERLPADLAEDPRLPRKRRAAA